LLAACWRQTNLGNLPVHLAKKLEEMTGYQLDMVLTPQNGQELIVTQWYRAPDYLRTDVRAATGELYYQFFLHHNQLTMRHVPTGHVEQLALGSENILFIAPLLRELWQEALAASWRQVAERPHSFLGEFAWRHVNGQPELGTLWLNSRSLLPEELTLFSGDTNAVHLRFSNITLNPVLSEQLFQP